MSYKYKISIILAIYFSFDLCAQNTSSGLSDLNKEKNISTNIFFKSEVVDFVQIKSSITDNVAFAAVIYKPSKPSPILLTTHGWHGSVSIPSKGSENPYPDFLFVQVDMRGRKYSTGKADCNGLELYDVYDAYKYVLKEYPELILDEKQVYFIGGSGGGGNGYALSGKFPDLFCSVVISCGISDYAEWFKNDTIGEFRDEMIPWIGTSPDQNMEAYMSRSGITTLENILSPVYIVHGETDIRVPVTHARNFYSKALKFNKTVHYLELDKVGTRSHWGNISPEQEQEKNEFISKGLEIKNAPELPIKGKFIVAGYIVTGKFSVFLDSIDSVGRIKYNLKRGKIKFIKGKGIITWL